MFQLTESTSIQPVKTGLKLINGRRHTTSAGDLLKLPFNVYFLDKNSCLLLGNEWVARNHEVDNINRMMGHSVQDYLRNKSEARKIIAHDRQIIETQQLQFFEEEYFITPERMTSYLSIKVPLISETDQVMGLLGFSTLLEQGISRVITFLNAMTATCVLQPTINVTNLLARHSHPAFTPREEQIGLMTQQGYTAKHIGRALNLSNRTVETHLYNMKIKLGVTTKNQLIDKLTKSTH